MIIAEVSGNHGGRLSRALDIVDAVAKTGAELLKIQTYTADTLTLNLKTSRFRIEDEHGLWGGRTLHDLYEEGHTPWSWHAEIFSRARSQGLIPFSSPFDPTAIELLEELECEIYKIASAELVDLPLIRLAASTGKPLIMSTGMATLSEVEAAVSAARSAGSGQIVLLACTAAYPAAPEDSRLANIALLRELFDLPVGLSDHTLGIGVAVGACALGAVAIEKHVTLDRVDNTVDSDFSMIPEDLALLVDESKRAWAATCAAPSIGPLPSEETVRGLRRSLYVVSPVRRGEQVSASNVRSIRPSGGLAPDLFDLLVGRTFTVDVAPGTPMTWDIV